MVPDLPPGANVALPSAALGIALDGPFDLSALVLSASGTVAGDADMVFFNQPDAPGVRLRGAGSRCGPTRCAGAPSGSSSSPRRKTWARPCAPCRPCCSPTRGSGRSPGSGRRRCPPQTVALLVEVYRRAGAWRVRAVGQGYADGLAGLARDFGVEVAEDAPAPGGGPASTDPAPGRSGSGSSGGAAGALGEVVDRTNAERARHGLPAAHRRPRLAAAAQAHSADMVRRGFFAHESPDGRQVWDRAVAAGYAYRKVAENIAAGQRTAEEVVRGWMGSPGHRANILDGDLTQIGVGRADGGSYGVYWTQVFGTPR